MVSQQSRVQGLDTLRFAAAAWVAFSHGAKLPVADMVDASTLAGKVLIAANNATFNGAAAVMVFFVLSGFVIHLPYAQGRVLETPQFLVRRLVRIMIPAALFAALAAALGETYEEAADSVLWSLYAELVFYCMYPWLRMAFTAIGSTSVTIVSFLAAIPLVAWNWHVIYFANLDVASLVGIGLPCWLMGCVLADRVSAGQEPLWGKSWNIWIVRTGAVLLSILLRYPATHGPLIIPYPASHWIIALYCVGWIHLEILHYRARPVWRPLEIAGSASYSLYLVHTLVVAGFAGDKSLPPMVWWALQTVAIAVATMIFFKMVELPSHRIARRWGDRVTRPPLQAAQQDG